MKKFPHKTILLSCLTMFGLLFNSCSVTGGNDINQNNMNLRTLSSPSGLYSQNYADASTGCYEIIKWSTGDANILFNDLQSKQRVFLSSDLGSKHDDESDPSYIKTRSRGLSIFRSNEYLYVIGRGSYAKTVDELDYASFMEQRELTGGIRNRIELPSNVTFNETGAFATGDDKLYFTATVFNFNDSDNNITYKYCLYSYNEKSGELSQFYTFDDINSVSIISAYDNILLMQCIEKINNNYIRSIFVFDVSTSSMGKILEIDTSSSITAIKSKIYILDSSNKISEYDTKNNSVEDLSVIGEQNARTRFVAEPVDDNIFIYTHDDKSSEEARYVFNTADKSLKEIDLYNDEGHFIGIYGRRGDYYFVITGETLVSFKNIAPDHMTVFDDERVDYEYAWIKKSDYCNSIPNFEPIESKIEYR